MSGACHVRVPLWPCLPQYHKVSTHKFMYAAAGVGCLLPLPSRGGEGWPKRGSPEKVEGMMQMVGRERCRGMVEEGIGPNSKHVTPTVVAPAGLQAGWHACSPLPASPCSSGRRGGEVSASPERFPPFSENGTESDNNTPFSCLLLPSLLLCWARKNRMPNMLLF